METTQVLYNFTLNKYTAPVNRTRITIEILASELIAVYIEQDYPLSYIFSQILRM